MDTHSDKELIFNAAADISDPADRQAFLDQACGSDAGLRQQVDELLKHDAEAGSFIDRPAIQRVAQTVDYEPLSERAGMRIGPYKLLQMIGEGGFGVVFMAE